MNEKLNQIAIDGFFLPRQSSSFAAEIDAGWYFVTALSIFFFVGMMSAMFYFMWKYRRRHEGQLATSDLGHHFGLEAVWTIIPTALCGVLFIMGWKGYLAASVAPSDAIEIQVTGQKWSWSFAYPNGVVSNELRVPKDKSVKLILSSKDVIHSVYLPEFRVKQDAVPGTYTTMWFRATEIVNTVLQCTEYCGTSHSNMLSNVFVMEFDKWTEWLDKAAASDTSAKPEQLGEKLFTRFACMTCHSTDGSARVGPTFKGLYGKMEGCNTGQHKVDEAYLRESILNPTAKVVTGFQPVMPPFQGQLKDREVDALIAYIKTLK